MSSKFLENLKVGDKIGYESNYGKGIKTIIKITKTMIILSNKSRYNKQTRRAVGADIWSNDSLVELTSEWKQKFYRTILKNKIDNLLHNEILSKLSDDDLQKIYSILNQKGG